MPNPIAHPAAAIPFRRAGLVFSALVIGSIAPDVGYFVPQPTKFFMYTITGLILFDVPAGLVLLWLYHALAKWPLLSLLPHNLQRRLFRHAQGFSFGPPKRFLLILLSLLVGSATHVVWDSFTHVYGWTVIHYPFLSTPVGGSPLYDVLQNLGTLFGVAFLLDWFFQWLPTAPQSDHLVPRFPDSVQRILIVLAVVSLILLEAGLVYLRFLGGQRYISPHFLVFSTLFSAVLVAFFFAGMYCLVWMVVFHRTLRSAIVSDGP